MQLPCPTDQSLFETCFTQEMYKLDFLQMIKDSRSFILIHLGLRNGRYTLTVDS